jgi:putative membrane protein
MWMSRPSLHALSLRVVALVASAVALAGAATLDELGRLLISVHMMQHLLLSVIAPMLLVVGRPKPVLGRVTPIAARRAIRHALNISGVAALVRLASRPLLAWILFCTSVVVWHVSGPYEWTLQHGFGRAFAAVSFVLAGLLFWRAVLAPGQVRRLGHGMALLMVVGAAVIGSLPGALMTFAPRQLYATGVDTAAICGLSPLEDQQLAGVMMWIAMDAMFFGAAGWLFVAWMREAERTVTLRMAARTGLPLVAAVLAPLLLAGCGQEAAGSSSDDTRRGVALIGKYGCGECHVIPGIGAAKGMVGPPLTAIGSRVYIAGVLRNSPENLVQWIEHPQSVVPGNAMPDMGIGHDDARAIAAYLDTLR